MNIANRIRQLRTENCMTQRNLADKLGLTPKMISFYENGERTPPIDILLKLVKIFDVKSDYILGISDDRHPEEAYEWRYSKSTNRLGNILANFREKKKITQNNMAEQLSLSCKMYVDIETGTYSPNMNQIKKLAKITGYDIDYLIGAKDHTSTLTNESIEIGGLFFPISEADGEFTFKERFESLCIKNGVNSNNCEELLSITQTQYTDIQFNRMPTLSELLRIAYAFNVSLDYLIGKTDCQNMQLNSKELALLLNYRDCLPNYQKNIEDRAEKLSIESIGMSSVAADEKYVDSQRKSSPSSGTGGGTMAV